MAPSTLPKARSTTLMPENCSESQLNPYLKPIHASLRTLFPIVGEKKKRKEKKID